MEAPLHITREAFLGSCIALISLSGIVVIARLLGGHKKNGRFFASDYLAVLAVIFVAATFAIFHYLTIEINKPLPPGPDPEALLKIGTASTLIAGTATWLAKAPILLLYIQLFGIKKWIRYTSIAVLVITALLALALNSWVAATCSPVGKGPAEIPVAVLDCTETTSNSGLATGAVSVITDVIILVLPIRVIVNLNLPLIKRISVIVVFLTGIFAVAASATSLYFRAASYNGEVVDIKAAQVWTIIELTIAIMVGCAPAAHAFWNSYAIESGIFSRLTSIVSLLSLTRTGRSTRSKSSANYAQSGTSGDQAQSEDIHSIDLTHPYKVLGDSASGKNGGRPSIAVTGSDRIPSRGR